MRVTDRFRAAVNQTPVRDMAETLGEVESTIKAIEAAAMQASEIPAINGVQLYDMIRKIVGSEVGADELAEKIRQAVYPFLRQPATLTEEDQREAVGFLLSGYWDQPVKYDSTENGAHSMMSEALTALLEKYEVRNR